MIRKSIQTQRKAKAILVALFLLTLFLTVNSFFAPSQGDGLFVLVHSAHAAPTAGEFVDIQCSSINPLECVFKGLLFGVLGYFVLMMTTATALFAWVVNPDNVVGILNKPAIQLIWSNVRDFLNMFFILVLLFSAFCTIFQVDKWNLKKVWLNVVICALLVNFSFAIARFVIDISNVTMYFLLNQIFPSNMSGNGAGSILAVIANGSGLGVILNPGDLAMRSWIYLIAAIIFVFILTITYSVLAVMFVIRLIALAILIMFAPIGFVGYIFPSFSEYADGWWKALFKYSFFAPIMVFMLAVAIRLMNAMGAANMKDFMETAQNQSTNSNETNWVASAAFFIIPIIILWIGMASAQKLGIAGAAAVVGQGQRFAKWGAKNLTGYSYVKKNYDAFSAARKKRSEEVNKNRWGGRLGDRANDFQDLEMAMGDKDSKAGKRYNKRRDAKNKEDIKNQSERFDGHTEKALHNDIQHMSATNVATMTDDQVKEAAGKVKQAQSRGATYEKYIEQTLKAKTMGYTGVSGTAKPRDVIKAVITTGMSPADIAMERDREKQEKDAMDKWVQEEKSALMDQARGVIAEAEKRGKIT